MHKANKHLSNTTTQQSQPQLSFSSSWKSKPEYNSTSLLICHARIFFRFTAIDSNQIRTHNHLVRKRALSLAKWLNVRLRSKWLWVRISFKLQIWRLLRVKSSLTFMQTIECKFTLKLIRSMIIKYSYCDCISLYEPHNPL